MTTFAIPAQGSRPLYSSIRKTPYDQTSEAVEYEARSSYSGATHLMGQKEETV